MKQVISDVIPLALSRNGWVARLSSSNGVIEDPITSMVHNW